MRELTEGTFLRWIDPEPDSKPLGIVISPLIEDVIQVLMVDHQGHADLEVFAARREATGVGASELVQESMEVAENGDPELVALLSQLGPNWWQISAHIEGMHDDQPDPECLMCGVAAEGP